MSSKAGEVCRTNLNELELKRFIKGVYCIFNLKNSKMYIGSCSYCIRNRILRHLQDLKKNKHHSIHLQRAFNKYGIKNFEVLILKTVRSKSKSRLLNSEQYYIDNFKSAEPKFGYNIFPDARSPLGYRPTKAHRKNLSIAQKKRFTRKEERQGLSKTHKELWKNNKFKKERSLKFKKAWTKKRRKLWSKKKKEFYNKHPEWKIEAKKRNLGKIAPNRIFIKLVYKSNRKVFNFMSKTEACKALGFKNDSGINYYIRLKKAILYKGYKCKIVVGNKNE